MLPKIQDLNQFEKSKFFESVDILFESAPVLADALYEKRPFESYKQLIDEAEICIKGMSINDKIKVINAHPRIGAPKESLSENSRKEQGYPVLDVAEGGDAKREKSQQEQLDRFNQLYEDQFGFKFVVFVNGRSKSEIIEVLKGRLESSSDIISNKAHELHLGLKDMMLIARDRLNKYTQDS